MLNSDNKFDFYSPSNLSIYALDSTMQYQIKFLDNLDHITKKHSENVANVTSRICEYLNCKKEFTLYATMCAYLHDIGKIFIPKEILFKDDELTDEEYEIIKKHTIYGYNLCMKNPKLRMYAEGALYHHECLDGSGYPYGIKGNKIPLSAQIIHVADVYDALVNKRHYTTHVNISSTLSKLIKENNENKEVLAFSHLTDIKKEHKINKNALNALFKVVIDDTNYEIHQLKLYINSLKDDLSRLIQIAEFGEKMKKQKSPKKQEYYANGMKMLFRAGETMDNYFEVLNDYKDAIDTKYDLIKKLNEEIKILKKLKV